MNATAVSTVLKEGTIIRTKTNFSGAWYENIVLKVQNNLLYIPHIVTYIENAVMPGSSILLKVTNEFFEYIFEGEVIKINLEDPCYCIVQVSKAEEMINTRAFPRYDVYLPSYIRPLWSEEEHYSVITNICLGGMAFYSKYSFDYGEESEISIYLPDKQIIHARGKTIRKNVKPNYIDYSLQFTDMDETNSNILASYLSGIEENWEIFRERYFSHAKAPI